MQLYALVALVVLHRTDAEKNWYCDFSRTDIPTQSQVAQAAMASFKKNSSTRFWPDVSAFREMTDRYDCKKDHMTQSSSYLVDRDIPLANASVPWPTNKIPFVIDDGYRRDTDQRIRHDMTAFNKSTCVQFVERTDEPVYIRFVNPKSSKILRVLPAYGTPSANQEPSEVRIELEGASPGYNGAIKNYVRSDADVITHSSGVMQTLMFTLGFNREENRHDRDEHIVLDFFREDPKLRKIFHKELANVIDLRYPYDTQSAAHMTIKDAEDLGVELSAVDPGRHTIKSFADSVLSAIDIQKVNDKYCQDQSGKETTFTSAPTVRRRAADTGEKVTTPWGNSTATFNATATTAAPRNVSTTTPSPIKTTPIAVSTTTPHPIIHGGGSNATEPTIGITEIISASEAASSPPPSLLLLLLLLLGSTAASRGCLHTKK